MTRYTRTVSASGGAVEDTAKSYEWELITNCKTWKCCYTGSLDIKFDPSEFMAVKVVMNGIQTNCCGSRNVWVLPKFKTGSSSYCNYWCCNSYNWMRPGAFNGCNGVMMCHYYCTSGCHPSLFSCCGNCIPYKLVGCIMSGNAANTAYGMHGGMCLSQGCNANARLNLAYMYNCWVKSAATTGACWKCLEIASVYSSFNFVSPRWNAGQTQGWGGGIPSWQLYGIRCYDQLDGELA